MKSAQHLQVDFPYARVLPNPALKGTPQGRGFANAPGSPLACIR
jgi:hypothetical protein